MRTPAALGVLAVLAALGACSGSGPREESDWERKHAKPEAVDDAPALPPLPRPSSLVEFEVTAHAGMRFFVDTSSIEPAEGEVVRYVLVARSPSGAQNVSFEGLRCGTGQVRRYAVGGRDGSWGGRPGDWTPGQAWHRALLREYFCPQGAPIRNREEGAAALRSGGHPFARGFSGDDLRLPR